MQNKKAMSDVVSTVLIILLVVAAIAIIGAIIINTVGKGGAAINSAVSCQALTLTPTNCANKTMSTTVGVVQLTALPTDATLSGVTFIYTKADGTTSLNSTSAPSGVGATVTITHPGIGYNQLKTFGTLRMADGSTTNCEPKITAVANCATY